MVCFKGLITYLRNPVEKYSLKNSLAQISKAHIE